MVFISKVLWFSPGIVYPNTLHWSIFGLTDQNITDIWEKKCKILFKATSMKFFLEGLSKNTKFSGQLVEKAKISTVKLKKHHTQYSRIQGTISP